MLQITIKASEGWDSIKNEFIDSKEQTLQLEHSLVSIAKWESKWCKPFLSKQEKTYEETLDYIRCMTLTKNVDPDVYNYLSRENVKQINEYIEAPMTATWFAKDRGGRSNGEQVTNELIYYWMISLNIPSEYEKWHLNHLLTLIKVCNIKNTPPKKMSRRELAARNARLNEARRRQFNTNG